MNTVFILVGFSYVLEAWLHLRKLPFHILLLSIFGISLINVGVFHHAPIIDIAYTVFEDKLHSIFASIVGFSFTFYTISFAFIEKSVKHRI